MIVLPQTDSGVVAIRTAGGTVIIGSSSARRIVELGPLDQPPLRAVKLSPDGIVAALYDHPEVFPQVSQLVSELLQASIPPADVVQAIVRAVGDGRLVALLIVNVSPGAGGELTTGSADLPSSPPEKPFSRWTTRDRSLFVVWHLNTIDAASKEGTDLWKDLLRALKNPQIQLTIVVAVEVYILAHLAGVGVVADGVLLCWGFATGGLSFLRAMRDFGRGLISAAEAGTRADLESAAETIGDALVRILALGFTMLLTVRGLQAMIARGRAALMTPAGAAAETEAGGGSAAAGASRSAEPAAAEAGPVAPKTDPAAGKVSGNPGPQDKDFCLGDPVDPATGAVFSDHIDFTLPGIVPLVFERTWTSTTDHAGELGHGWHHSLDMALGGRSGDPGWTMRLRDGRLAQFDPPAPGRPSVNAMERLQLWTNGEALWATGYDGQRYDFGARCPDGLRRLTAIRDLNDNAVALTRDDAGRLVSIIAGGGRRLTVVRDAADRIIRIDGPAPEGEGQAVLVAFTYDAAGDLVATADAAGAGFRYGYTNHLLSHNRWPAGVTFSYRYDDPGKGQAARCVETTGPADLFLCRFEYAPDGRTTTVRDGRGATRIYESNAAGRVTALTDGQGRRTAFERDENQRIVKETRADGAERTWRFDARGRLVAARQFDGAETLLSYAPAFPGQPIGLAPVRIVQPGGRAHAFAYDQRGNLVEYIDPAGRRQRFVRGAEGLPLAIRDDLGVRRLFKWTSDGRLEREATSRGARLDFAYDRLGRLIASRRAGEQPVRYRRDAVGNVVEIIRADGGRVVLGYDEERQVTLHRDATGAETRWVYDGLPYPRQRTNPDGSVLRYRYDTDLNLVGLVNAKGEEYRLVYDLAGQLVEEVGFDGRRQAYEYNDAGHLVAHSDAEGRGARYQRDRAGRLLERVFADGTTDQFEYDATGALTAAVNASRGVAFRYDRAGALAEEHQDALVLRHTYDARGRRVLTELPDGRRVTYGWGEDDSFVALGFGGRQLAAITRDVAGRETERRAGAVVVASSYDPQGRLARQAGMRGGARVLERSYEYDPADRVLGIADLLGGTRRYVYDPCDRLVGVGGDLPESFAFDPAGNILGEAGQIGGSAPGDRLAFYGDRKFEYDGCGNRVREVRGAGGGVELRYDYGPDNQLRGVEEHDRRGVRSTSFAYDALGRRISKHHVSGRVAANDGGSAVAGESRVCFLWDGDRLLAEGPNAADVLDTVYLHEPGTFRPIALVRRGGAADEVAHYHLDHLGTPREVTNDNGAVVWQASLEAWGAVAKVGVAEVTNPLRFQGQYHDVETGLHYNRFRYYSPDEGRFVHEDPIRLAGGSNSAAYAPNPVAWTDPFGQVCQPTSPSKGSQRSPGTDFVVYPDGTAIPTSKGVLKQGFDDAGFKSRPSVRTAEQGTVYEHPNSGILYRVMEGSQNNPPRLMTHAPAGNPVLPNGENIPSSGLTKDEIRAVTHFPLDP